ncbi:MAG: hypothetical protein HYU64_02625 [Armatimonadetes bacterium]|nr:hypothetical protein [Armatimonadota bacterium]
MNHRDTDLRFLRVLWASVVKSGKKMSKTPDSESRERKRFPADGEDQEWPEEKIRANNEMNKAFVRALEERKKYP